MKEDGKDLKDHLVKDLHYVLVPRDTWKELVQIFGFCQTTVPIKRKVIRISWYTNGRGISDGTLPVKKQLHATHQ